MLLSCFFPLLLLFFSVGEARGESANVSWAANPEGDIGGYTVSLGTTSGNYTSTYDAGNTTALNLPLLSPSTTYYCAVTAYNIYGLTGTPSAEISFTTASTSTAFPEIAVTTATGLELESETTGVDLGSAVVGGATTVQEITITNQGNAPLSGLGVSIDGVNAGDFSISSPSNTLAAGASETVQITFTPTTVGPREATLTITSNDADESAVLVSLIGTGTSSPTPDISITSEDSSDLGDGSSSLPFGSLNLGAVGASQTITIRNVGTAALTGLALSVGGTNASDFVVSSLGTSSLNAGANTTFIVTFTPTAAGTRSAVLHIASNDADESPFDIALSGTGLTQPEIAITKADGTDLVDGVSSLGFGSVQLGLNSSSVTYTLKSTGTAALTGLALSVDGANAPDFVVSSLGSSSLNAGANTTFTVTFRPSAPGTRSAVLHITSNDADESPFDIALSGTALTQSEIAVTKADGTDLVDGVSSLGFGSVQLGLSSSSVTYTIKSTGTAALTGLALSVDGANAADFAVSSLASSSLNVGANTTFTVTFTPTAAGTRSAVLHIASNDADESPFDIALTGTALTQSEIAVTKADGTDLVDGVSSLGFGSVQLGLSSSSVTYTIKSTGTAALTGLALNVDGANAADFLVSSLASTSLNAGSNSTFTVTFVPTAAGTRSAVLHITSNDADESPFDIALSGTALTQPEIAITKADGSDLVDGVSSLTFGSLELGETGSSQPLIVKSNGTGALAGLAVTVDGAAASDFVISSLPGTAVNPGANIQFTIHFQPKATGLRTALLHITSNDADESPFDIVLTGTGFAVPRIAVLDSNDQPVSSASPLSLGIIDVGMSSDPKDLAIRSIGTADLTGITASVSGIHASDFVITSSPSPSLAPDGISGFSIIFTPTASGLRTAMLTIGSNDPNQGLIQIPLVGTAAAHPRISVQHPNGTSLINGATALEFGSVDLRESSDTMTCTLSNTGTADLTNLLTSLDGTHAGDFEILTPALATLKPGQSSTFAVRFTPVESGPRKALLRIASNDSNRGTISVPLTGKGVGHPEIEIALDGQSLAPARISPINFGSANTGETGATKTFTIRNTGTAALSGIKVLRDGSAADDFRTSLPSTTSLKPGASTTFKVTFQASGKGRREAMLTITSNDEDNTASVIPMVGTSVPVPKLAMKIAGGSTLTEKRAYISFVDRGSKSLVITNRGNAPLNGLKLAASGMHIADFNIEKLNSTTLAPGRSVTIKIRFNSGGKGNRWGALKVLSNDLDSPQFEISLVGKGASTAKSARVDKPAGNLGHEESPERPIRSIVTVDGKKYRCITIPKTEGRIVDARQVEVSSDLVDWNSGRRFTKVIKDNEHFLKVRDNTPITDGEKRHIRYRSGK